MRALSAGCMLNSWQRCLGAWAGIERSFAFALTKFRFELAGLVIQTLGIFLCKVGDLVFLCEGSLLRYVFIELVMALSPNSLLV